MRREDDFQLAISDFQLTEAGSGPGVLPSLGSHAPKEGKGHCSLAPASVNWKLEMGNWK
jgi:hypothetical protein